MTPITKGVKKPRAPKRLLAASSTMKRRICRIRRRVKVLIQRPLTNFLLFPRLSSTPSPSITITGTTKANAIVNMIPGIIRQTKPTDINPI